MSWSKLYPEPPHLTIAVYPEIPESKCFATACDVVERLGGRPAGVIEVAPWEMEFEMRSDLAGRSSIVDAGHDEFHTIAAGDDPSVRPIRAGYMAKRSGVVVVEYLTAPRGRRHPIAVSTSAGVLGIPDELWGKAERGSASKTARWALQVLQEITTRCPVAYGAIGVEFSLPTPSELASGEAGLPSEVFLPRGVSPGTRDAFTDDFRDGEMVEWPTGWFFSGWGPFNTINVTLPPSRAHPARGGRLLGRAIDETRPGDGDGGQRGPSFKR